MTAPMSEAELQKAIVDYARLRYWTVAHFRPARTQSGGWATPVAADGAGFPDLVMARDRVLFVELKSSRGRQSASQKVWQRALEQAGAEFHLWSPDQWLDGTVERVLGGRVNDRGRAAA